MDSRTSLTVLNTQTYLLCFHRCQTYNPFMPNGLLVRRLRNGDPVFAINSVLHTPLRRPMSQFDNFFDHQTIKLNSFGQGKNYIRFYLSVFSGKISVFLIVQHFFRTILCTPYIGRFHFGSSQQVRTESLINPLF